LYSFSFVILGLYIWLPFDPKDFRAASWISKRNIAIEIRIRAKRDVVVAASRFIALALPRTVMSVNADRKMNPIGIMGTPSVGIMGPLADHGRDPAPNTGNFAGSASACASCGF
jgi:hypothetical protein